MPFSGPEDPKLPSNVRGLTKPQREKWVKTWNSTFANCRDPQIGGAGSVQKCEATAFKIANGTIKKEAAVKIEETKDVVADSDAEVTVIEDKDTGVIPVAVVEEPFRPFGGATSFEELDAFREAQDQAVAVDQVTFETERLISNVMSDEEVENRPNKITQIANDMRGRLAEALANAGKAIAPTEDEEQTTDSDLPKEMKSFQILKEKDGDGVRWMGIPSNKWRDRDHPAQIIEEAAHLEFVKHLDETKNFPILLSWHTPGTRIGVADVVDYSDGFLIMSGPIDKGKEAEAERLAEKCDAEEIGMSHGFVYTFSDKENQIIGHYRMWEVSHLPVERAANVWTAIDILKKEVAEMPFDPKKREYLVGLHGEEIVAGLEGKAAQLLKDLLAADVEFKDILDEPADTPAVIEAAVKAIVESDGFKALIENVGTLAEAVKAQGEDLAKVKEAVASAITTAESAEDKAQKTVDEIIAEAVKGRDTAHQPSKDNPPISEEETAALAGPDAPSTGFAEGQLEGMTGPAATAVAVPMTGS